MSRIKIDLPANFPFTVSIPIRITDLNYGGHVGNDTVLSLIHEARVLFLAHFGYKELEMEGVGLIMSDVGIEYKAELFHGDILNASVAINNFTRVGFDVYYKLEKIVNGKSILVAAAKTGMVCYNYSARKIAMLPPEAAAKLQAKQ
jgi:acyl-CoA thioester hydrolase